MKMLFILMFLPAFAIAADLSGKWYTENIQDPPVQFIKVGKVFHFHSQERVIFQDGRPSHTIDQNVTLSRISETEFQGLVSFYDSRGCTFKDLEVMAEFQDDNTLNVLMTVPRYQYGRNCLLLETVQVPVQLKRLQ